MSSNVQRLLGAIVLIGMGAWAVVAGVLIAGDYGPGAVVHVRGGRSGAVTGAWLLVPGGAYLIYRGWRLARSPDEMND